MDGVLRVRRVKVWLGVMAIGLLLGGCADGSRTKPAAEPTHRSPRPDAEDGRHTGALRAYRAMWRDLAAASRTSDASSPRLDDHARGNAVALMKYGLKDARKDKIVSKGTPYPHPRVISSTSEKVTVRDCVDGTKWLEYKRNGGLKNHRPGSHVKADATVKRTKGEWKVSRFYLHEDGSC